MDVEFHYYITYVLARRARFKQSEAETLAYASQYTDDNNCHYMVNMDDGDFYFSEVSQTMDITKPSQKGTLIYVCFHFMPGDRNSPTARRKDKKTHPLNTIPNNESARQILDEALKSGDLYRIGIATHTYADTWAHQNFVGKKDAFNEINGIGKLIPSFGHADAIHEPDKVHNRWKDPRLIDELEVIHNNDRFLDAAEHIFRAFWERPGRTDDQKGEPWTNHWSKLKGELEKAMDESFLVIWSEDARREAYCKLCKEGSILPYDPKAWKRRAIRKEELELDIFDRYWAVSDFHDTDWFKFQEAVKAQRALAVNLLHDVLVEAGSLPTVTPPRPGRAS